MSTTTRTQIPREVDAFYNRTLIARLTPLLTHLRWAQIRDIPRKAGTNVIRFRSYSALPAVTTALTESVTPTSTALAATTITATALAYGSFVTVSDVLDYESPDNVLLEASELLAEQAGLSLDTLARDVLIAGTTVRFVGQSVRTAITAANVITVDELRAAFRTMQRNNARRITTMVNPETGFNTTPIAPAYVAITTPEVLVRLKGLTTWIPVERYAANTVIMDGEEGSCEGFRFVVTPQARVFVGGGAAGTDVHTILCLGADAYGVTRISGEAIKNIIKPLGSAGSADPLDQRATSGWKATFVTRILNELAMLRIECAA